MHSLYDVQGFGGEVQGFLRQNHNQIKYTMKTQYSEDKLTMLAAMQSDRNVEIAKMSKFQCQKNLSGIFTRKRKESGMTQRNCNEWLKRNGIKSYCQVLEKPERGRSYSIKTMIKAIDLFDQ